jgi:serine/threonine protein kinase
MTPQEPMTKEREQQLYELLLDYEDGLEGGEIPDRAVWLAHHAAFAAELKEYFRNRDELERLAEPFRFMARWSPLLEKTAGSNPEAQGPGSGKGGNDQPGESAAQMVGQLGDFRILREIGRGGMGIVYEAQQISLDRLVALKVLPFAAVFAPRQLQRFRTEAQAAAQLHHPSIVPVFAVGCERGIHYYAMQLINGRSLQAILEELRTSSDKSWPRPLSLTSAETAKPESAAAAGNTIEASAVPRSTLAATSAAAARRDYYRTVARLGVKAAEALDYAHQNGIVHRDIKPANLLIDAQGNLWITDFGLALFRADAGTTGTGEVLGTLRYMSPEQASGRRELIDHRTDIYSLGASLYELLARAPAFAGEERGELLRRIIAEEPRKLRSIDRAVPVELETIVHKAMAKVPSERYATAQDLAEDLLHFLDDRPIRARPPTLMEKLIKWSRRHTAAVAAAATVLVLSVVALGVSTILIARANRETQAALERERIKAREAEENFRQARRAVDFFTQVSEVDLADRPSLIDLRKKLLETALAYYQDFLQRGHDDASVQAELTAGRRRVDKLTNELAAMQGFWQLQLLQRKEIQEDLGLSKEAVDQIADAVKLSQQHEVFADIPKKSPDDQQERYRELARTNQAAIERLLTPAQSKRLKQIILQSGGINTLRSADVAKALHLSKEQKDRIRALQHEASRTLWESSPVGGDRQERHKLSEQVWKKAYAGALDVLEPEQRADWQEMIGPPFRAELRFMRGVSPR